MLYRCANLIEAHMEFTRKKKNIGLPQEQIQSQIGHVQAREIFLPTSEQNNSRERCRISVRLL